MFLCEEASAGSCRFGGVTSVGGIEGSSGRCQMGLVSPPLLQVVLS